MSTYTVEEKLLFFNLYSSGLSSREIAAQFAGMYPDRPVPSYSTVLRTVQKLKQEGCLVNHARYRNRGKYVLTDDKKISVLCSVEEDNSVSVSKLAEDFDLSVGTVYKVLKAEGYKSYKYQNHQELMPEDPERRSFFCETMIERFNTEPELLHKICFTDESVFSVKKHVNSQNCRYWSRTNQHLFHQTHSQYRQSVCVWLGLLDTHLVGPFFIQGSVNTDRYLELLQNSVVPAITNLHLQGVWFQQDGAPAHYSLQTRNYLNQVFPNRWIGRGGIIEWPARSPDLSPNDFSLWGYLKSKVYTNEPINNLQELKDRISASCAGISLDHKQNILREFQDRLGYCLAVNGGHFENLL